MLSISRFRSRQPSFQIGGWGDEGAGGDEGVGGDEGAGGAKENI
ncbi:hypothetical protein [Nostoc sp. CHAB 5715]|nr:hypothetical protein [Nostoc sp. CHAB 5715]